MYWIVLQANVKGYAVREVMRPWSVYNACREHNLMLVGTKVCKIAMRMNGLLERQAEALSRVERVGLNTRALFCMMKWWLWTEEF